MNTVSWKMRSMDYVSMIVTSDVEVFDRAAMEADIVARTTDLMLLRQRMIELERTVVSLRPS